MYIPLIFLVFKIQKCLKQFKNLLKFVKSGIFEGIILPWLLGEFHFQLKFMCKFCLKMVSNVANMNT